MSKYSISIGYIKDDELITGFYHANSIREAVEKINAEGFSYGQIQRSLSNEYNKEVYIVIVPGFQILSTPTVIEIELQGATSHWIYDELNMCFLHVKRPLGDDGPPRCDRHHHDYNRKYQPRNGRDLGAYLIPKLDKLRGTPVAEVT